MEQTPRPFGLHLVLLAGALCLPVAALAAGNPSPDAPPRAVRAASSGAVSLPTPAFEPVATGRVAARAGGIRIVAEATGLHVVSVLAPGEGLVFGPAALGRGEPLVVAGAAVVGADPTIDAEGRARLSRAGLTEVLTPGPGGIELSYEVPSLPAGAGDLWIAGSLATELRVEPAPADAPYAATLVGAGGIPRLRIGRAWVRDAQGREASVRVDLSGGRYALRVSQAFLADAAFPILVDPRIGAAIGVSATGLAPDLAHSETSDEHLVVWAEGGGVKARRLRGNGIALGGAFSVAPASASAANPSVAWLEDGNQYLVAYEVPTGIRARRVVLAAGGPQVSPAPQSPAISIYEHAGDVARRPRVGGRRGATGGRWLCVFEAVLAGSTDIDGIYNVVTAAGTVLTSLSGQGVGVPVSALVNGAPPGFVIFYSGFANGVDEMQPAVNELVDATAPWTIAWSESSQADRDVSWRGIASDGGRLGAFVLRGFPGHDTAPAVAGAALDTAIGYLNEPPAAPGSADVRLIDANQAALQAGTVSLLTIRGGGALLADISLTHAPSSQVAAGEYFVGLRLPATTVIGLRADATPGSVTNTFLSAGPLVFIAGGTAARATARGGLAGGAARHGVVFVDAATSEVSLQRVGEAPAAQPEHPTGRVLASGGLVRVGHAALAGPKARTYVTVRNPGLGDVRLTDVSIIQAAGNPFAIASAPAWVGQGQASGIEVTYDPQVAERTQASLQIETDVPGAAPIQLSLAARAADAAAAIDPGQPVAIPAAQTVRSTLTVPAGGPLLDLTLHLDLRHPALPDLEVFLEAPTGLRVQVLATGTATGADLVGTSFEDGAAALTTGQAPYTASFTPHAAFSGFHALAPQGTWTLEITDHGAQGGDLTGWSLDLVRGASAFTIEDGAGRLLSPGDRVPFGQRVVGGAVVDLPLTIRNPGTAILDIQSARIVGPQAGAFSLPGFQAQTIPVASQTGLPITVRFDPAARGRQSATLEVTHDALGVPNPFPVALFGIAADAVQLTGLPLSIPDPIGGQAQIVQSALAVTGSGVLQAIRVHLDVEHSFTGDLALALVSPQGTRVALFAHRGGPRDLADTTFDDLVAQPISAGQNPFSQSFRPEAGLMAFAGEPRAGTWTLEVTDDAAGDVGTLRAFSLELDTLPANAPGIRVRQSAGQVLLPGDTLFLGHLALGQAGAQPLSLENFGTAPLSVSPQLSGAAPWGVTPAGLVTVAAGGTETLSATLTPTARGTATGSLDLVHPAANAPSPYPIRLEARAADAAAAIDPLAPTAIPDDDLVGSSLPLVSSVPGAVQDVRVHLDLDHTAVGDLALLLESPGGTLIGLSAFQGGFGDDYRGTTFSDGAAGPIGAGQPPFAGAFQPEEPLARLSGEAASGTWTLHAIDAFALDVGAALGWSIDVDPVQGPALLVRDPARGALRSGETIDFGPVLEHSAPDRVNLAFENHGLVDTRVTAPTLSNVGGGVALGDLLAQAGDHTLVAGGGSAALEVRFAPRSLGSRSVTVEALHSAQNLPSPFTLTVQGRGVSGRFVPAQAVSIPDASATGTVAVAHVPRAGEIQAVRVTVDIRHAFLVDLTLALTSPQGTRVVLLQKPTTGSDLDDTTFADGAPAFSAGASPFAGTFAPVDPLAGFAGEEAFGDWTLHVVDDDPGGQGILRRWSLEVETVASAGVGLRVSQQPGDAAPGRPFGRPAGIEVIDRQGQRVASDDRTRVTVSLGAGPQGATLSGTRTVRVQAGVASFSDLSVDKEGVGYELRFEAPGLVPTSAVPFAAGAAATGGAQAAAVSREGGGGGSGCQLDGGAGAPGLVWWACLVIGLVCVRRRRRRGFAGV